MFNPLQNQNCKSNLVDLLVPVIPESNPNNNPLHTKLEIDDYVFHIALLMICYNSRRVD